jgi:chemotaxis protein CheX
MPILQEITEAIIQENINRAVSDVFTTMLGSSPTLESSEVITADDLGDNRHAAPSIVGTVGFIGDVNGLIYLYFGVPFARLCTQQLLGMTEEEIDEWGDEVVNDAIGEMTNMTVGGFKNSLCDAGYPCTLTIPSILRGSNFSIEPISSTSRHIFNFECTGHQVVADILLKIGD